MRRLLLTLAFDGSRYHGWQVQQNALAVQQVMQDAVEKVFGSRLGITGCSRTDSGVHAREYCCHFDTESGIPCGRAVLALNTLLPPDIAVLSCEEKPMDFHARYSCTAKEYVYQIYNSRVRDPFLHGYALQYFRPLDETRMQETARLFLGEHDFSAFCSAGDAVRTHVRTIYSFDVAREGKLVTLTVRGNGFLYNMVRILAGTLLCVEQGRLRQSDIPAILASKDRNRAGKTAPPYGLYLNRVFYDS